MIILLIMITILSCKELGTSNKAKEDLIFSTRKESNHPQNLKKDTFYLKEKQIIFFRPDEEKYYELVKEYGQAVIEADSDFGFTIDDLMKKFDGNTGFSISVIKNNAIVYDWNKDRIFLPKEDINSYGSIISGKRTDSIKIVKGVFPIEFYIEEINKWND